GRGRRGAALGAGLGDPGKDLAGGGVEVVEGPARRRIDPPATNQKLRRLHAGLLQIHGGHGGMTGRSTCEGCFPPQWRVTLRPNTSGGRSCGSLWRKGPTPVKVGEK